MDPRVPAENIVPLPSDTISLDLEDPVGIMQNARQLLKRLRYFCPSAVTQHATKVFHLWRLVEQVSLVCFGFQA